MNVRKLSTMLRGVLKNFLNKEGKNKVNYTRYIFLKERGKIKQRPIFPSSNEETKNETWNLDIYQIIATCSHLNEISIISSIIGHHEITLSILVFIYLQF